MENQQKITDIRAFPDNGTAVKSILIIEDDDLVRLSISRYLTLFNYRIKKFASAEEALQSVCGAEDDIIITDFNLPGMNGIELTKIVKQRGLTTPVIMISAIEGYEFESVARTIGVDAIFGKPINVFELRETIEKLVERNNIQ
jgi:DNA-binding response OmpR family regulator